MIGLLTVILSRRNKRYVKSDVPEIAEAVGKDVGVFVAKGDGSIHRASMNVMKREG